MDSPHRENEPFAVKCDLARRYIVLLVEDNEDDELLARRALRRCGIPVEVHIAHDGPEALEALASVDQDLPKVVFLDLKLPRLGGIEVLRAIRNDPRTARLPVVCMTSSDEPNDRAACYDLLVNSFIQKPVDFDEYLHIVQKTAEYWLTINRVPNRSGL